MFQVLMNIIPFEIIKSKIHFLDNNHTKIYLYLETLQKVNDHWL
jgi:hypothetical protein